MKPMEVLSVEDKERIYGYMRHYGAGGGYPMDCGVAPVETILRYWDIHKQDLFAFMGQKLIVEKHIDIEYPGVLLWTEIEDKIFNARLPFVKAYNDLCSKLYDKDYNLYLCMTQLLSVEALCNNIYEDDNVMIPTPGESRPIALNRGCKVAKMLAKIAHAYDLPGFEEFRLRHSMILNRKRLKGTLCISIHPLDYMTMSDNNYNWDSCMSWQKPGEYRMGTVEMMNSECAVVAYLRGDKDMACGYNHFNWSNKRWRQLFVVNPALIAGIKGYPYCDALLEKEIFEMFFSLDDTNIWNKEIIKVDFDNDDTHEYKGKKIQFWFHFAKMYDDFYIEHNMAFGTALKDYLVKKSYSDGKTYYLLDVMVSGNTECMTCGRDLSDELDEISADELMCGDCSGLVRCPHCGDHYPEYEMHTLADGEEMCSSCFEYHAKVCHCCGQYYFKDNIYRVYAHHCGGRLDEYLDICWDCKEGAGDEGEYLKESIGPIQTHVGGVFWRYRLGVDTKNFTDHGFEMFGFTKSEMEEFREEIAEYTRKNLFN